MAAAPWEEYQDTAVAEEAGPWSDFQDVPGSIVKHEAKQETSGPWEDFQKKAEPQSEQIGGPWGKVLDYFDLQKQAQAPEERSKGAKVLEGLGILASGMVPKSLEEAKQMAKLPMPSAEAEQQLKESEELGKAWRGEYGLPQQVASIGGSVVQALPLAHIPMEIGRVMLKKPLPPPVPDYAKTYYDPDLAKAAQVRQTLTPEIIQALAEQQPESMAPIIQREATGPVVETAIDKAMRMTGQPARTAAEIAITNAAKAAVPPEQLLAERLKVAAAEELASKKATATVEPDEAATTVAKSPVATAPGEITPGQGAPAAARPVSVDTGPEGATTGGGRGTAPPDEIGVAETYAESELGKGSVVPGTRQDPLYWRQQGRTFINSGGDPRMPIRAANAGHTSPRNVGIVSAEYERLTQLRRQTADNLQGNPTDPLAVQNFNAADAATRAWRKEMQPVLTRAGESLAAIQGEHPVDLTTFDGLHDAAVDANNGQALTKGQQADLVSRAGKTQAKVKATDKAVAARDQVLQKSLPRVKVPTEGDMNAMVENMVRRMTSGRTLAERAKQLRADTGERGFVTADHLQTAIDIGRDLYTKGMDAMQWAGEMIRHLGNAVREHLGRIWSHITGQEPPAIFQKTLPGAYERGAVGATGEPVAGARVAKPATTEPVWKDASQRGIKIVETPDGKYQIRMEFVGNWRGHTGKYKELGWQISKKNSRGEFESMPGAYRSLGEAKKAAASRAKEYGYEGIGYTVEERNAQSAAAKTEPDVVPTVPPRETGSLSERIKQIEKEKGEAGTIGRTGGAKTPKPDIISDITNEAFEKSITPEERATFWEYAKALGANAGMDHPTVIQQMATKFNMPHRLMAQALDGPKSIRRASDEVRARQRASQQFLAENKRYLEKYNRSGAQRLINGVNEGTRRTLLAYHGPVPPQTHAIDVAVTNPVKFIQMEIRAFKAASPKAHEDMMKMMEGERYYDELKAAGMKVGNETAEGFHKTGWAGRGMDAALGWIRLKLAQDYIDSIPPGERTPEDFVHAASEYSHATGSLRTGEKMELITRGARKVLLAPLLTPSKIMKTYVDPVMTVRTMEKMVEAKTFNRLPDAIKNRLGGDITPPTAAERRIAENRIRRAGRYAAATLGGLAVNQAILSAIGSRQKVNFTHPERGDYLGFKFGGRMYRMRGSIEMIALAARLYAASTGKKKFGAQSAEEILGRYGEYKLAPGIGLGKEIVTGKDIFGRPAPWSGDPGTYAFPRKNVMEFVGEHGPIFIGHGISAFHDSLRQHGVDTRTSMNVLRAIQRNPHVALKALGEAAGEGGAEFFGVNIQPDRYIGR